VSLPAPKPIVAIIGRPNVGKSTLFNRLTGKRLAIVHDEPGVTRDRHYADADCLGQPYTLVDTGGFDPEGHDEMQQSIREQIEVALDEADVILCLLDCAVGPTSMDDAAMARLRQTEQPVIFLANKADSDRREAEGSELYRLGMAEIHFISALHGRGLRELDDELARALAYVVAAQPYVDPGARQKDSHEDQSGEAQADPTDGETASEGPVTTREPDEPLRVAVVGRPNAGKSSLINRLLGEDRMLVDAAPGTTRDPIDALIERRGRSFVFVDTAGLRRKSQVTKGKNAIEALSVIRGIRAIDRAHLTVLLCDAARGVSEQDAKILGLALDRSRGVVVALNKTDLLDRVALRKATTDMRDRLSFASWIPAANLSALTGRGTGKLLEQLAQVGRNYHQRVGTGALNRFFESVLTAHTPPVRGGRAPRFYYMTQAQTAPPLFVVETSHPDQIHFSYQRYVINAIRKQFGFQGVPIRVRYRRAGRRKRQ
jgi:GTP-binding protein